MKIAQPALPLALLLALALAGCSGSEAAPGHAASHAPAPSAEASSAAPTGLPAGALFRITALFATPNGEHAQLVETVMSPVAPTGDEASRMTAAHCGTDWSTAYPDPAWMTVQVTSTLLSGTTWPDQADDIIAQVDGFNSYAANSGGIRTYQAPCASGLVGIPATGSYLLPVDRTARPDSAFSWGHGTYGFAWASDGQDVSSAPFAVTNCTLERSDAASASAAVSSWDPAHPDPGSGQKTVGCSWGTV